MTPSAAGHRAAEEKAPSSAGRAREDLERFFELSLDLLCVADFSGRFTRMNPAFERVLGHSSEELLRHPFISFVHPDDREATEAEYASILAGGETLAFENRYEVPDRGVCADIADTTDPTAARRLPGPAGQSEK